MSLIFILAIIGLIIRSWQCIFSFKKYLLFSLPSTFLSFVVCLFVWHSWSFSFTSVSSHSKYGPISIILASQGNWIFLKFIDMPLGEIQPWSTMRTSSLLWKLEMQSHLLQVICRGCKSLHLAKISPSWKKHLHLAFSIIFWIHSWSNTFNTIFFPFWILICIDSIIV